MYHYLKWAALSLFLRRNLRCLLVMLVSLVGISGGDAVYRDLADYFIAVGRKDSLFYLLLAKWALVASLAGLFLFCVMRLGFSKEPSASRKRSAAGKETEELCEGDPIMKRLEKFREKKRLKRRSDMVLEWQKRKK